MECGYWQNNWIDRVIKDGGEIVGRMLNTEVSRNRMVEGQDVQGEEETIIEGLTKNTLGSTLQRLQKQN
jgi:hypothetical protein